MIIMEYHIKQQLCLEIKELFNKSKITFSKTRK